jgi:hypothetical protein
VVVDPNAPSGWRRVLQGFTIARQDRIVRRVLVTCTVFSFFCLIFIAQMPTVAVDNLGMGKTCADLRLAVHDLRSARCSHAVDRDGVRHRDRPARTRQQYVTVFAWRSFGSLLLYLYKSYLSATCFNNCYSIIVLLLLALMITHAPSKAFLIGVLDVDQTATSGEYLSRGQDMYDDPLTGLVSKISTANSM